MDAAQLDTARQQLAADTTLNDAQKQKAMGLYNQADDRLRKYKAARTELLPLQARIAQAPERIKNIRHEQAKSPDKIPNIPDNTSQNQLQLWISQQQTVVLVINSGSSS